MTPLPVRIALAGSIALGTAGICDLVGIFPAIAASRATATGALLAGAGLVAGLIVWGGEAAKARLLEWAQAASGLRSIVARAGWCFFVALSICLSHAGLVAAERAILAPVVAPIELRIERAEAAVEAAERAERQARARVAARVVELNADIAATPSDWSGRRERADLRRRRDEIRAAEADALRPMELATASARADLAEARAALDAAPKGFMSLAFPLPFGLPPFPFVAWLIPVALEYLTGLVGWIAAPRRQSRAILHEDVLALDAAGLELLAPDQELLRRIASKHASLAAKAAHILSPRGRKAS